MYSWFKWRLEPVCGGFLAMFFLLNKNISIRISVFIQLGISRWINVMIYDILFF